MECPRCQRHTPTDASFCPDCGFNLTAPITPGRQAERRQLTVMFCDLVGSTELSQKLDPEELSEVVAAYQAACARPIARFDGYIAQYLGDGVLVYFGYPHAHEDDAERAVHTGLGIVEAIDELNERFRLKGGLALAVRVGVHTGLAVVGDVGVGTRRELLALGDTPNLADQFQRIAAAGTVVIGAATHRLVRGLFRCADLGEQAIKGVAAPVRLYQVAGATGARSRFEATLPYGLTPLVGRKREVGVLLDRWAKAAKGAGQVVLLEGEAGIGKSRLVEVLKADVTNEPHVLWECRSSPYFRDSAFHPIIDLFSQVLKFGREDTGEEKFQKLTSALCRYGLGHAETVALFAALLSLPLPDGYPGLTLGARRQKQKTFDAILTLLMEVARQKAVLFVVQDLHWVDPSTFELLHLLIDHVARAAVCMILTFRPDARPPWSDRPYLTRLSVGRLSPDETRLMVGRVAGDKVLPAEVVGEVVDRTDGVPLFVEELTKMVLESRLLRDLPGRHEPLASLPRTTIPTTLHDSLMARLDSLPLGKGVAQVGAILGRSFSYELARAVMSQSDDVLQRELRALVDAELLYQTGTPPSSTYIFKHSLIQEAACESLLKSTRQQCHGQIAHVLAERFPDVVDAQPELVAYHFTEAGLPHEAIRYWQRAGWLAARRSAHAEAIAHLKRGLALVGRLDAGPARDQQEVELRLALGTAIVARQGYGAAEVGETLARARSLVTGLGESQQLFPVRWALWRFCLARADLRAAADLARQLLATTELHSEPGSATASHVASGVTTFYLGEFAPARSHLLRALVAYDPAQGQTLALTYGQDLGIGALGFLGWADAVNGDLAAAADRSEAALRLARELGHPFSLALALLLAAEVRQLRRESALVLELGQHLLELAHEHSFVFFDAFGLMFTGWAQAATGDVSAGLTTMGKGADLFRSIGQRVGLAHRAHLAEALTRAGQPADAIDVVTGALQQSEETCEAAFVAELYRVRGEAFARLASFPDAERCFRQAVDLASRQGAWLFALRAACGLVRLPIGAGSARAEARGLLEQMAARFPSTLNVGDLPDARALLATGR